MPTRGISPRDDGEGNIGRADKAWNSGFFKTILKLAGKMVATLDNTSNRLEESLAPLGRLIDQGAWNPNTNSPALGTAASNPATSTNKGYLYRVSVDGTRVLDGTSYDFKVGDFAYSDGTVWRRWINSVPTIPTGLSPWTSKTANYTIVSKDRILASSSGGTFTLTCPASPSIGDEFDILDPNNSWTGTPLTLARNGEKIENSATNLSLNVSGRWVRGVYTGSSFGWKITTA